MLTGAFLPSFDFFVVNVALPSLEVELGARPSDLEFVIAGYGLAFAILLVTGGRLGDLLGRKRMFMAGMAGFTLASALCGLAPNPAILIASRVLQGLTAAIMSPQVLAIIRTTFPENERARAFGYFTTAIGFASILAQVIGGALIEANIAGLGWRPIFLVNVPVGLVALAAAQRVLRESRSAQRQTIDVGGILLGTAALVLLVFPLVEGRQAGWPAWSWWMLIAAGPAMVAFVLFEWSMQVRGRTPLVNLRLFRDRAYSLGLVMTMTFFGGLSAFFLSLTVFLQDGFGFGPLATGLVFVGFGFGFMSGSIVSARIARVIGPRTICLGTGFMATGLLTIVTLALTAQGQPINHWLLTIVLLWYGTGQGLAMPTLVGAVVGSSRIPAQDAGAASGVFSMVQQVAFALGVAVVVGVFYGRLGTARDTASYQAALALALACNAGLMITTGGLALLLPRKTSLPAMVHVD